MKKTPSIGAYIKEYPKNTQKLLQEFRTIIKKHAPQAEEGISYGIPTFKLHGNLVHFGGYKNHVALYPGSYAIKIFAKELSSYKTSKGTIQFPLDKPLPRALIAKIVKFRVQENKLQAKTKKR